MNIRRRYIFIVLTIILVSAVSGLGQRRITPVTPPSPTRTPVDSAALLKKQLEERRARSVHYHDSHGRTVMVDTVTNTEWIDSAMLPPPPKMIYPLWHELSVGVNIFDPLMRAFGQHYGGMDASVSVSMHNRFFPTFEFGMGAAKNTPADNNYTYRSPLAPYFKLGADYNFIYNSDPDYRFFAGVRYGFSPFKFSVTDVTLSDDYWQDAATMSIPTASVTAGWFEIVLGLRVKIWGPVSAGWQVKYHSILHQSHPATGDAWYIPGYGTQNSSLGAAVSITYTIPLNKPSLKKVDDISGDGAAGATGL